MALNHGRHPRSSSEREQRVSRTGHDTTCLPSQRIATPPPPGTEDAAFLDNLNEVYGAEDPQDDALIEGIRRHTRTILDHMP